MTKTSNGDISREEFEQGIKEVWDKRNEQIMEVAAPIIAQHADGSFRDALNGLQKFMSSGVLTFSIENIISYLDAEQIEKVRPWLIEKGYSHLLKP